MLWVDEEAAKVKAAAVGMSFTRVQELNNMDVDIGRAVQVDPITTRVESTPGFSA